MHGNGLFGPDHRLTALAHTGSAAAGVQDGQVKVVDGHHFQKAVIDVLRSIFSVPRPGATRIALTIHNTRFMSISW